MYHTLDFSRMWTQYLQFTLLLTGVYASRINSAIIALSLLLLTKGKAQIVSKLQPFLLAFGVFSPALLVGIVFAISPKIKQVNGSKSVNFQFGKPQAAVSLIVLTISLSVIILSMILSQRRYKKKKLSILSNSSVQSSHVTTSTENALNNTTINKTRKEYSDEMLRSVGLNVTEDSNGEDEYCNWKNTKEKTKNERDCQMLRHTVLLIFTSISMAVGKENYKNGSLNISP